MTEVIKNSGIFLRTIFPFGIFESSKEVLWDHKQHILPALLSDHRYQNLQKYLPKSLASKEDKKEFHSFREYQTGDPLKDIDWKATARMNKAILRTYKSTSSENDIELLYYPGNQDDLKL